jgi:hypothetical protein
LGTAPDREVGKMIGQSVVCRDLGIAAFHRRWTKAEDEVLGKHLDHAVAAILRVSVTRVSKRRRELGIPAMRKR